MTDLTAFGERTIHIDCDVIQGDGGTRTASITGGYIALVLALKKIKKAGFLQEWPLTQQIAAALEEVLAPQGVAVSVSAFHLCMAMRGVQKQASQTTTTAFTGAFQRERHLRKEFLALIRSGKE